MTFLTPPFLNLSFCFDLLRPALKGITDFFKRKFDFVSVERIPKFSDVKREYNMDEDLKASGYNKQIEKELEEELRPEEEEEDKDELSSENGNTNP